jgi:hypothetical protein
MGLSVTFSDFNATSIATEVTTGRINKPKRKKG